MSDQEVTTLTVFLLARIAEDEWIAQHADNTRVHVYPDLSVEGWVCHALGAHVGFSPARVLADCQAKRRIVEMLATPAYRLAEAVDSAERGDWQNVADETGFLTREQFAERRMVLLALAQPYADHPDYDDEAWRP